MQLNPIVFSCLFLNKQLGIKVNQRPIADLKLAQQKEQLKISFRLIFYTRKFDRNIYNKTDCICGARKRSRNFVI